MTFTEVHQQCQNQQQQLFISTNHAHTHMNVVILVTTNKTGLQKSQTA